MSQRELVTLRQACAELGVSRPTLAKRLKHCAVEPFKVPGFGQQRCIRRVDLELLRQPRLPAEPRPPGIVARVRAWLSRGGPREHKAS